VVPGNTASFYPAPKFKCDPSGITFSSVCLGGFDGTFRIRLETESESYVKYDKDFEVLGLSLSQAGTPRCRVLGDNVQMVGSTLLPEYKLRVVYAYGCNIPYDDFVLDGITVITHPSGPKITKLDGRYKGTPGQRLASGAFRSALEKKYGKKNCSEDYTSTYCFRSKAGQQILLNDNDKDDGTYNVEISDRSGRYNNESLAFLQAKLKERENSAPVNKF
jgi:hypothetical protein